MPQIQLTRGFVALVDEEDVERCAPFRWCARGEPPYVYAHRGEKKGGIYKSVGLHRFLLNAPDDREVDHINHDTLDNRRTNLAIVTASQNKQNTNGSYANSSTGVRGVTRARSGRYQARFNWEGRTVQLGTFTTLQEADTAARQAREQKYWPHIRPQENISPKGITDGPILI